MSRNRTFQRIWLPLTRGCRVLAGAAALRRARVAEAVEPLATPPAPRGPVSAKVLRCLTYPRALVVSAQQSLFAAVEVGARQYARPPAPGALLGGHLAADLFVPRGDDGLERCSGAHAPRPRS